MGRLFWKFFLLISLAQLTAVIGISNTLWVRNRTAQNLPGVAAGPSAEFIVASAAATLHSGGPAALRHLLEHHMRPVVYALDESNHDLLGREVSATIVEQAKYALDENPDSIGVRRQDGGDGHTYLLFAPAMRDRGGRGPGIWRWPLVPTVATLVGSLLCAALLARYLSKPIRNLRFAFESAASGDLNLRIAPMMAKRNDELANLSRDFDRMAMRLQTLLENRRRLFHDVSHELRSPLARLQVAAGLARQYPDAVPESLERVDRECRRMSELVDELLTLSKLEAGVDIGASDSVDLQKLIADVVEDARFEANTKKRDIVFSSENEPMMVRGQMELLHRAIENVVRNAMKHTPDGTKISIVLASIDNKLASITIDDEGPGVPETELNAIFQPFFRGTNAQALNGHGLGLSIAQRVIEAHRGEIHASNRASGGLRVEIKLPLSAGDSSEMSLVVV